MRIRCSHCSPSFKDTNRFTQEFPDESRKAEHWQNQSLGKTNSRALSGKGRDNKTVASESQQYLVFIDLMPNTISHFFFIATS